MDMTQLRKMLENRKGELSDEKFGNAVGVSGSVMFRYLKRDTTVGLDAVQKMIPAFAASGDTEMVGALMIYAAGLKVSNPDTLRKIGELALTTNGHESEVQNG